MPMNHMHEYLENHSHIIWDWNGTLLDDLDVCVGTINQVLTEWNLSPISVETYKSVFGFPVMNYYEKIGFDFKIHDWEQVSNRFIQLYINRAKNCQLFTGTKDFLTTLKGKDKRLSILTASHEDVLMPQLAQHGIHHLFDGIYALKDHYAISKVERGRELIKDSHIPKTETLLIGDTDHDFEVAQELGVDVLIIADGHQSYERLSQKTKSVLKTRKK